MQYKVRYEVKKNNLPKIASNLKQESEDVVARTVLMLVEVADPITPVGETGNLKNNKTIDTGSGGTGSVTWHAPYTGFVIYGTRYMVARPFIQQAVAQVWPIFQDAMQALAKGG